MTVMTMPEIAELAKPTACCGSRTLVWAMRLNAFICPCGQKHELEAEASRRRRKPQHLAPSLSHCSAQA
jgi:hypothetical protein